MALYIVREVIEYLIEADSKIEAAEMDRQDCDVYREDVEVELYESTVIQDGA